MAAVGADVEHWKDGDRVGAGWHGGHDGVCKACKKGMFQMCGNRQVHGETKNGGCKLPIPLILRLLTPFPQMRSTALLGQNLRSAYLNMLTLPNMHQSCVLASRASTRSAT